MSKDNRNYDLEDRLIDFAIRIIRGAESLPKTKVGNHIAEQLIRSVVAGSQLWRSPKRRISTRFYPQDENIA